MSSLPSELTDAVIDHLHADKIALAVCALVCKEWLPASRYHLFSTINVDEGNIQQFFDILDTPLCIWQPLVRHLNMAGIRRYTVSWLDKAHIQKLSTLVAVKKLSVRNFNSYEAHLVRILFAFGGINELHIAQGVFPSFSHLMQMIILFPLKRLTLEENTYFIYPLTVAPTPSVEWIGNLHVIHLRSLLHREIKNVGTLLRDLGPSLTHLYLARPHFLKYPCSDGVCVVANTDRLGTNTWRNHLDMYYAIDLGQNTNLQSVHFGRIKLNQLSGLFIRTPLVWMQMLLSQIKSSQMQELRFLIEVDFFHDLNQIDWNKLADLFAQPRFSRLKKIHFDVQRVGCVNASSAEGWIKRKLPDCDARGILSIRDARYAPDKAGPRAPWRFVTSFHDE